MKDILGYEGLYAATSCGRIWSYNNKKFLKPIPNGNGYLRVHLYKDGKRKEFLIHRLVADAYLSNPDNLPQVNHIDGNKEHNYLKNLEFCTASENNQHAYDTGLRSKGRKTKRVHDQLTGIIYTSCSEAARAIGGNSSQVCRVCNKRIKAYKGHVFTYID